MINQSRPNTEKELEQVKKSIIINREMQTSFYMLKASQNGNLDVMSGIQALDLVLSDTISFVYTAVTVNSIY